MDGSREYASEINQSEKDKHHLISFICGTEETKQRKKDKTQKTKNKKPQTLLREFHSFFK